MTTSFNNLLNLTEAQQDAVVAVETELAEAQLLLLEQQQHNQSDYYDYHDSNQTDIIDDGSGSSGYNFTHRHVAMAWVPHISGLLSLIGSSLIIWDILQKRKRSTTTTTSNGGTLGVYERLLFGLAISDIIASLGMFLSTWPVPDYQAQSTWGAVGNIHTCEFQGFIIQLGLATPIYSAALALYYVLLVKFNWNATSPKMKQFEKFCHVIATTLAVTTAVICLAMKQYNNANIWCWIAPYPYGCEDTGTCERGNHATLLRMVFYFSWLWLCFIIVTVSMIILAYTVFEQTTKMDRYRQKGQQRPQVQNDRIRNVTIQSALYILAFMITALPLSVARIYQAKYSCSSTFFPLSITTVTVFPLQGFWNAIIYFRTRFTRHLQEQQYLKRMSTMLTTATRSSMFSAGRPSLSSNNGSHKGGMFLEFFSGRSTTTSSSPPSLFSQREHPDEEERQEEDACDNKDRTTWCAADLQKEIGKMKDESAATHSNTTYQADKEDNDDEEEPPNTLGNDESPLETDTSENRRLRQYQDYLDNNKSAIATAAATEGLVTSLSHEEQEEDVQQQGEHPNDDDDDDLGTDHRQLDDDETPPLEADKSEGRRLREYQDYLADQEHS